MTRLFAAAAVALVGGLAAADDPPPAPDPVAALVARLGHADFAQREDAERRLSDLGPEAVPALREAAASDDPEVARRAGRAVARILHRAENDKLLAPTLVTLAANDAPLDAVLADLSKQSGFDVTLAAGDGTKPITVKAGKVSFWQAVLAVCDAADLKIAAAGGFLASDAGRQLATPRTTARNPTTASSIFLEPRNGAKKRPAVVYGAVLVEAVPVPDAAAPADASIAVLQVWPEPGLNWQAAAAVRLDRATDAAGQARTADAAAPLAAPQVYRNNNVVIVNQPNGGVVLVNPNAKVPLPAASAPAFTPSDRQFVVRLKPAARPAAALADFRGTLYGTVRVGPEPMIALTDLKPDRTADGSHPTGAADLRATIRQDAGGKWRAVVDLAYDTARVQPDTTGAETGRGVYGLRVSDADGHAYLTYATSMSQTVRGGSTRQTLKVEFELHPAKLKGGPPTAVTFWAVYGKPAEVPFAFTAVPLAGGARD